MFLFENRSHRRSSFEQILIAVALFFAGLALIPAASRAQSGAGSIQGTVTDSTGAVIPGAVIHVVNQATAVAASTKANSVGFYQVPGLFTGTYEVTISAPNMRTFKTSLDLLVAQNAVINATLGAGQITQQVQVSASTVQLTTTDNGTISATLENQRINQLPMNGRNVLSLTEMTTPGLEAGGQRANGLMGEALEYVADGAPLTNRQFGGMMSGVSTPDPDAVQEVQLETTNTSAQYTDLVQPLLPRSLAPISSTAHCSKRPATTSSASPRRARIRRTSRRPSISAMSLAPRQAVPSSSPMSITARTRASGSWPTSATHWPVPAASCSPCPLGPCAPAISAPSISFQILSSFMTRRRPTTPAVPPARRPDNRILTAGSPLPTTRFPPTGNPPPCS